MLPFSLRQLLGKHPDRARREASVIWRRGVSLLWAALCARPAGLSASEAAGPVPLPLRVRPLHPARADPAPGECCYTGHCCPEQQHEADGGTPDREYEVFHPFALERFVYHAW